MSCPKCGSERVRKVKLRGPDPPFPERLGFYPYRCSECSRRFTKFRPDVSRGNSVPPIEMYRALWKKAVAFVAIVVAIVLAVALASG